jgi:hypothetical protein
MTAKARSERARKAIPALFRDCGKVTISANRNCPIEIYLLLVYNSSHKYRPAVPGEMGILRQWSARQAFPAERDNVTAAGEEFSIQRNSL